MLASELCVVRPLRFSAKAFRASTVENLGLNVEIATGRRARYGPSDDLILNDNDEAIQNSLPGSCANRTAHCRISKSGASTVNGAMVIRSETFGFNERRHETTLRVGEKFSSARGQKKPNRSGEFLALSPPRKFSIRILGKA